MKSNIKKISVSFLLMIIINLVLSTDMFIELGIMSPNVGLLYVLGLLFGPYGAIGAVSANVVIDCLTGVASVETIPSSIFSIGISYLAYKFWYSGFKTEKITRPRLDNSYHFLLFLSSIFLCGLIDSTFQGYLAGLFIDESIFEYQFVVYLLNFINQSFIFGIIGIWLSRRIDWIETPKTSDTPVNRKLYRILFYLLVISTVITFFSMTVGVNKTLITIALTTMGTLLYAYLTKPFEYKVEPNDENTIIVKIIRNFIILMMVISILGVTVSLFSYNTIENLPNINIYLYLMPGFIITDIILLLFAIPGFFIVRYIEQKVIKPISSFSEIEKFIQENEKIETEGLVDIYSKYVNEQNEIGTLARSYTDLINHNNNYIENIREIEGEKERINAELDIATNIQAAALPTESLETNDFIVDGYSKPAKEVGGDFFDYYMIDDENLAIVIGDASGKGVPAALIAMVTQVIIKQILEHDTDPSKVLYSLNNQLSKNNPESMFLTLWLGIYNKTTQKLTFSNAGHNPPLMKENGEFRYMKINSGIVLGIMEGFEYIKEEITLTDELVVYTDGITDAANDRNDMYGEDRLLNFFNVFESDDEPIVPLLNNIHDFTGDAEQFDDMTLTYVKIK